MPAQRRRYSKGEKAKAVGLALVTTTEAAAESSGIPESTLRYWMDHADFAELRTKTRDEVADQMWATIQIGVKEIAKGIVGDEPLRDKAMALGVLYDKFALMTGSATSRTEARDITGSLSDGDVIAAIREAVEVTAGGGTPASDQEPPAG